MNLRGIILLMASLLLVTVQTSLLPHWDAGAIVTAPVVFLILLLTSASRAYARWMAVVMGAGLDLFSPLPFGTHLVALVFATLIAELLYLRFFTNRSIYAMIVLTIAASLVVAGLTIGVPRVFHLLHLQDIPRLNPLAIWQPIGNLVAVVIGFYLLLLVEAIGGRLFFPRRGVSSLR